MTLSTDKAHGDGMDLIDLLLRNTDETTSCHSNQPWTITIHDTLRTEQSGADDFLDALLGGSDSSSAPASPLWSPCTTDSDIYEDLPTDPTETPHPPSCKPFSAFYVQSLPQPPPLQQPPGNLSNEMTDVSIDLGWECGDLQEQLGIAYYLTTNQCSLLSSSRTHTVKDLLQSNLQQKAQQIPQHSLQDLVLNEDEKKLLAKEGVNLPTKLPLSKCEERILKKIRRKIRNKHSAQESRKKKREYVDNLEERMSACSAHNLQLQRKVQQLEKTNNALLEQLSRVQALHPNSSSKTTHRGTCILVLLLSFSLLISSNLQPDPYSQLSQGEYTETRVPSRSLQSMDEVQDVPPSPPLPLPLLSVFRGFEALCSLTEKLWPRTDLPNTDFPPSNHQDHKHLDNH
ncbi:hypothetical protein PAMP_004756 [Pampus punctatissimus]